MSHSWADQKGFFMSRHYQIATVFGGTGFVGRQVVRELALRGVIVKVATRVPERANYLRPCGAVGQIVPFICRYGDAESVAHAVKGSDFVINCVGILFERGKSSTFQKAHVEVPARIAQACAVEGVERFVHVSSLSCDKAQSKYAKSKLEGEKAVLANFPRATILRPSVIFGPDDHFFKMFAELSRYVPCLPLIGGGHTQLQPVYVGDVADAVMACLFTPRVREKHNPEGKIYELGGPEVLTFRQIYEKLFTYTERKRMLVSVPWGMAKVQASFLSLLPSPLLTCDQVETLKSDNVVSPGAYGFETLGLQPKSLDLILPGYLEGYRPGGKLAGSAYKT